MSKQFHNLKLDKVVRETPDSVSLYFQIPSELKDSYAFIPGQYLTLKVDVNGEELRRPYSICTANYESELGVTVKRVVGGKVSNHLNDKADQIKELEVLEPDGKFIIKPNPESQRNHIFICAGSGITPVMSMMKSLLEDEPKSSCFLLYGNTNEECIIFEKELADLGDKYAGQLYVTHTLSRPLKIKKSGLKGLLGSKKENWSGEKGRIDNDKINDLLDQCPRKNKDDQFYLCGPGALIDATKQHLESSGFEMSNVHQEYFTTDDGNKKTDGTASTGGGHGAVKVILNGKEIDIMVEEGKTILDTLVEKGEDPPYSCTSGACSTCVAKTLSGKIEMDVCHALDDSEIKEGYVLTCQSHPRSENVIISYDE